MFLEVQRVSRKTPGDGKLEISPRSAARIRELGGEPVFVVNGARGRGAVIEQPCTCAKAGGAHVHHFLASELLKQLAVDSEVSVDLLEDADTILVATRLGPGDLR